MKYKVYNNGGEVIQEGEDVSEVGLFGIPTSGGISLQRPDGKWINLSTNEDMFLTVDDEARPPN